MPLPLACPLCHEELGEYSSRLQCTRCEQTFTANDSGFLQFLGEGEDCAVDVHSDAYAAAQRAAEDELYQTYLGPFLQQGAGRQILDLGCGIGHEVTLMIADGYDAYGVDVPSLGAYWAGAGNDAARFFNADALQLPFLDASFDVVVSRGVIEHIGTVNGHNTLLPDYRDARRRYAAEILRVLRPNGRVLVTCPNKNFPVDIQHGPNDDGLSRDGRLRNWLFAKTGITVHRTWGTYHLLSPGEVKRLFCEEGGARAARSLPLRGYFGFRRFERGFLRPFALLATAYVNRLPRAALDSCLNPYTLVEIRK